MMVMGAAWLATTVRVEDVLLKGVALLGFHSCEALLYRCLATASIRNLILHMLPLRLAGPNGWRGLARTWRSVVDLVALCCCLLLAYFMGLAPIAHDWLSRCGL